MYTAQFIILMSLVSLFIPVLAQEHNVTVDDTDPSITYEGTGTGDAPICKIGANGQVLGNQPGCYFFPSNCTSSVAMSQNLDHNAAASFSFKGSAVYINSGLDENSPIYTVTLDGQSTDVDGVRPSLAFTCAPLFSQTNLDPTIEHTITLSVKGPSPNRNMTVDPDGTIQVFSLIDIIYTVSDPASNSSSASARASLSASATGSSTGANAASATSSTGSNSTSKTNAAGARIAALSLSGVLALGVCAMLGATAFSIL